MKNALADSISIPRNISHAFYEGARYRIRRRVLMTFRAIIPARIRKTDTTNERFSERINRERLSVSTACFLLALRRVAILSFSF